MPVVVLSPKVWGRDLSNSQHGHGRTNFDAWCGPTLAASLFSTCLHPSVPWMLCCTPTLWHFAEMLFGTKTVQANRRKRFPAMSSFRFFEWNGSVWSPIPQKNPWFFGQNRSLMIPPWNQLQKGNQFQHNFFNQVFADRFLQTKVLCRIRRPLALTYHSESEQNPKRPLWFQANRIGARRTAMKKKSQVDWTKCMDGMSPWLVVEWWWNDYSHTASCFQ